MSVHHAEARKVVVHLHEQHASVTKRRTVTARLRRRLGFGVSNTNHRERVILHCQDVMVTRDPFEPRGRGWATEGIANTKQAP